VLIRRHATAKSIELENEFQENPVTQTIDCAGYFGQPCGTQFGGRAYPDDRTFTTFEYASGPFSAQLGWQWIDGTRNAWPFVAELFGDPDPVLAIPEVSARHYFDLGLGWAVLDTVQLRFVINNLFDEDPPLMADAVVSNNTDSTLYDLFGRSYYLSLAWEPGR
jgi:outer membrane receptor protein involved in Fe transport